MQNKPNPISLEKGQRRFRRRTTIFSGRVVDTDRSVEVVVLDVSVNGAKLRVPVAFTCNRHVSLEIKRLGKFAARVVWQRDGRLGLQFTEPPEKVAKQLPDTFAVRLGPADEATAEPRETDVEETETTDGIEGLPGAEAAETSRANRHD